MGRIAFEARQRWTLRSDTTGERSPSCRTWPTRSNNIGNVLKVLGRLQEARGLSGEPPARSNHSWRLCQSRRYFENVYTRQYPSRRPWSRLRRGRKGSHRDRIQLDFALGKAYADLKDYSRSFRHCSPAIRQARDNCLRRVCHVRSISPHRKDHFRATDRVKIR